jgi:hypothetical protein
MNSPLNEVFISQGGLKVMKLRVVLSSIVVLIFVFACSGPVGAALSEGLVFLATFDDKSGDKVSDLSGSKNNGTVKGKVDWTDGKFASGFRFDGATYITVANAKPLSALTHPMSSGAWVNPVSFDANNNIVEMDGATGWKLGFTNGIPQFTTYHVFDFNSKTKLATGGWSHVAATWDGKQVIFYINGEIDATVAGSGVIEVSKEPSLDIGYRRVGAASFYKGILDDVFVYKRLLTQTEIKDTMKGFASVITSVEPNAKIATTWGDMKKF